MLRTQHVIVKILTTVKVGIIHQIRWALIHTHTFHVKVAALITT